MSLFEHPSELASFYAAYGYAVFTAQALEMNLATFLSFHEARKRAVLRLPTSSEIDNLIDEIDGNPIGCLLSRIGEHQVLTQSDRALFDKANENRRILVHHFMKLNTEALEDLQVSTDKVWQLADAIRSARDAAQKLVELEIQRMEQEIGARQR